MPVSHSSSHYLLTKAVMQYALVSICPRPYMPSSPALQHILHRREGDLSNTRMWIAEQKHPFLLRFSGADTIEQMDESARQPVDACEGVGAGKSEADVAEKRQYKEMSAQCKEDLMILAVSSSILLSIYAAPWTLVLCSISILGLASYVRPYRGSKRIQLETSGLSHVSIEQRKAPVG